MKSVLVACFIAVAASLFSPALFAQDQAGKLIEARKQNAALMKQYTWHSRTELLKDGSVKDIRLDLVTAGPDGSLQRTTLNNQGAQMPRGFLRRAIADDKKKEMESYMAGLRTLLDQYTLPTAANVVNFMSRASIQTGADGLIMLTGNNVVEQGDTLTMWLDPATRQMRRVEIMTTFQDDPVTAHSTFATLASGLNYLQYGEVEIPTKDMSLQIHNFDYERSK